jgi:hypothetical protein
MSLPTFLIIGAAKAGTNALYHDLRQHPQIYMSPWKEPKFFAFESEADLGFRAANGKEAPVNASIILDQAEYEKLFDDASDEEVARGEASTHYLYVEKSPARIKALIPDAKLIAVLRNPVDRAFSSYQHLVRDDLEPLDFGAALDAEPERIAQHYAYLYRYTDMGFYSEQLDRYEKTFPESQLCVLLYDDLRSDPEGTCRRIFSFLGVDEDFVPDMSGEYNRSGVPKNRFMHRLLNPSAPMKRRLWNVTPRFARERLLDAQTKMVNRNLQRQTIPEHERDRLREVFREEIGRLETRLDRDLSRWLG